MVGWLAKKAQNSRVYMCIKEVKWELETATPLRQATILALAQYFRGRMLREMDVPDAMLDKPLDYSRSDLWSIYDILETLRNQNTLQLDATIKNARRIGMELPQFSIDHAKATSRALEVWMATLGAGIVPDRRDDVRAIWSHLSGSLEHVEEAIIQLRTVEQRTSEMTGMPAEEMFAEINPNDWLAYCRFVPSALSSGLNRK
jgi:hypothetical protein